MNWTHVALAIALSHAITAAFFYALGVVTGYKFAHWQVWAWLLLPGVLWAHDAPELTVEESGVSHLEANHFYDEQGRLVFDQLVFWRFEVCRERTECQAWRLIKGPSLVPYRDWQRGGWTVLWQDGDVVRLVNAPSYSESYTQYDVELESRNVLPKEKQRGLRLIKVDKPSGVAPSGPASGR